MNNLDRLQEKQDLQRDTQQRKNKVLCDQCGEYVQSGANYYELYNEVFCEECKDFFLEEAREVAE